MLSGREFHRAVVAVSMNRLPSFTVLFLFGRLQAKLYLPISDAYWGGTSLTVHTEILVHLGDEF